MVIFDEFHERSLQADTGLALCLDSQGVLREDLRILVMSATLDGAAVAQLLGDAPLLTSEGRSYPVAVHYRSAATSRTPPGQLSCGAVTQAVQAALREEDGSVLVFLPGTGEIRRLETALQAAGLGPDVRIAPLYGQLDARAQDAAIQPPTVGIRKVVLATAIAETSLTIEGIRVVIDAGLMRQPAFDPNTGLTRLVTRTVSRASAEQRCGRAGRLQPGICYRLWPEHQHLLPHTAAEILTADLAPLVLELAHWGVRDVAQLAWLDPPPAAHVAQASALLQQLDALDGAGRITAHGTAMLQLGTHPRLAHMMLYGAGLGYGALSCELAALLEERDPLHAMREQDADVLLRLELLRGIRDFPEAGRGLLQRIRTAAGHWRRQLQVAAPPADHADLELTGVLLACAYPDRIAQRRKGSDHHFLLSSGRGARFAAAEPLAAADYLACAHLDGQREARIFLAARIDYPQLLEFHSALVTGQNRVSWDAREQAVQARRQLCLGELVLRDEPWPEADPQQVQSALLQGIRACGSTCLPWKAAARQLQARLVFMHRFAPQDWPDVSDAVLMATLEDWLVPYLHDMGRLTHLDRLDLQAILRARLTWEQQQQLDELAPSHLQVPSGSRVRLDYGAETPVLAVRLQEMFGLADTPRIAGGQVPVLLHLLSPARRPVQVTSDLSAFWQGSYHDVKKELKGRYPKHHWPDDPLQARATTRTRRKRR
jgi:ATP-dependent helicase HrpB